MIENKKTSDLLEILNNTDSEEGLKRYVQDTADYAATDFLSYFIALLDENGISKAELVKKTGIERTYLYQLLNGQRTPTRDYLITMCIAAGLKLEQVTRCLELSQEGILYAKNKRDSVLIYAINRGYNVMQTNELLFEMNEELLAPQKKTREE